MPARVIEIPLGPQGADHRQFKPGDDFNPYKVYEGWSVRSAIRKTPDLTDGEKLLWLALADFVFDSGREYHSVASLAAEVRRSETQTHLRLRRLIKRGLVRTEHYPGLCDVRYLTYHLIFAVCLPRSSEEDPCGFPHPSPADSRTPPVRISAPKKVIEKVIEKERVFSERKASGFLGVEPLTFDPAVTQTNGHPPSAIEQPTSEPHSHESQNPNLTLVGHVGGYPLKMNRQFIPTWKKMTPRERDNRLQQVERAASMYVEALERINDPDEAIREHACVEKNRAGQILVGLGFFIDENAKRRVE